MVIAPPAAPGVSVRCRGSARAPALTSEPREQRARFARRTRARVRLHDLLPAVAGARRILERAMAETDLHERLRSLRTLRVAVDDLLKLDEPLPIVPLPVVGLPDPVLRVGRE